MGVLLPNYPEKNIVKGENVPNFKVNTGTSEGTSSNVFQILQDLQLKQYQHQYNLNTVPNTSKMFHTTNTAQMTQMAQPVASFRTTTSSAPTMTDTTTTKQVNPVHVHQETSCKAPLAHCAHVHKLTVQVCKPGKSLTLRKVKHPHDGRTSVNRLPLMKQDILSQYSGCFEGIGHFQGGTHTNFTSNQNTSLHDTAPRKVPIHLESAFKEEIESLVNWES